MSTARGFWDGLRDYPWVMHRQLAIIVVSVALLVGTSACSAIGGGGGGGGAKNVHGVSKNFCARKPSSPKCAP